tara:strand:+ start:7238 stop:7918 length:681 start_codon:yes stop_codon:yes gene_type:complete
MAWGAVTNFKDRLKDIIAAYTGAAGGIADNDDNAIQQWLLDGCYDVIEKMKVFDIASVEEFVIRSSSWNDGTAQDLDEVRDVTSVERNGYPARPVSFTLRKRIIDSDSIHYATEKDPVFYIGPDSASRKLVLKPDASGGELGYYYYIPDYAITSWNTSTSSIDNFPKKYYEHVLLYAATRLLERHYLDLINEEEDLELAQGIQAGIQILKQRYIDMFMKPNAGVRE